MSDTGRDSAGDMIREHERRSRAYTVRAVSIITAMLLVITVLHLFTTTLGDPAALHLFYRRLYYVPILYAAFVFGRRGGFLAAVAASVPFAMHAQVSLGGLAGAGLDNTFEIIMYFAAGILFGSLRDLEERKARDLRQLSLRLEDAYKRLEERAIELINVQDYTQSILRSITSGVLTVGPDGSITTVNPAAERMLGASEYDLVPKSFSVILQEDGGLGDDLEKVLAGRLPLALREITLVTHAGKIAHVQTTTSRMRAVGGRILGAVITIEDVSEIKTLTQQLIRADRLAAMGELTAGVAHEVRNPLGVIRASVQLLEEAQCDQTRVEEAAGVIKQEIDRLDRVIKALLDFGRPSQPLFASIDVEEVVTGVLLFTSRFAKQSEVQIEEEYAGELPPVFGDADQLKQVFLNLVTNAVQVMEERGGTIRISTSVEGSFVQIEVADSGPGIPPSNIGKVFDPFFSTRDDGTGLGLTIVHRIIDEHGGHIEVESGEDGTTFKVGLPIAEDDLPVNSGRE